MQQPTASEPAAAPPRTSYDEVPYFSKPFAATHPDHLATKARLLGLEPPPPGRSRVLELACAAGGNLIPMAVAMPDSEFVGVDLSSAQIEEGSRLIAAIGLKNVRLLHMSIADVDESLGQFDYVIAHGVYSWVPNAVQERILEICGRQMSARGVGYVSYNTLPGWHMKGMIRDLMRFHAMEFGDPTVRVGQARAILDFLAASVQSKSAYGMLLQSELESLRRSPDYYVLHEHLEDVNEPLYFHDFVARARRHGLQYLSEAGLAPAPIGAFQTNSLSAILGMEQDIVRQEQLLDFLLNRSFRRTLLVHDAAPIERSLPAARIADLWIASPVRAANAAAAIRSDQAVDFRTPNGMGVRVSQPIVKAALAVLGRNWPASVSFRDLLDRAAAELGWQHVADEQRERVASVLIQCFSTRVVEFHSGPSAFSIDGGTRPRASALARHQALSQDIVTSLRHESVRLGAGARALLPLLDGTLDPQELRGREVTAVPDLSSGSHAAPDSARSGSWSSEDIRNAIGEIASNALLVRS